jgi:Zn finger protein HypA/HybF involved in hydrogenase expression
MITKQAKITAIFKYKRNFEFLMHDTLISKDIIEAAEKKGEVKGITVEVGDLGHLPLEELRETLTRMKPECDIRLVPLKAKAKCVCGYEGEPNIIEHSHGHSLYNCPKCGNLPEITEGKDITLKEVEVE